MKRSLPSSSRPTGVTLKKEIARKLMNDVCLPSILVKVYDDIAAR